MSIVYYKGARFNCFKMCSRDNRCKCNDTVMCVSYTWVKFKFFTIQILQFAVLQIVINTITCM